ncbi:MAG TPA: hypothetical protein V6C81_21455 [Planktothrix sp.]
MNIWALCALGVVLCVAWAFGQYRLHVYAEEHPSLLNNVLNVVSRLLLAAAITAVGFTFIGAVVEALMQAMIH